MEGERRVADELDGADDAFLVGRAIDGDPRAFGALLQRYAALLRRYVDRLTRRPGDTDDVLQETALAAWQHLGDLADPARVRAWLVQIATRAAFRQQSDRRDELELDERDAVDPGPDAALERLDLERGLQTALDALPAQQARCWVLRELGGYRYSEIAEQLQVPESTVRGSLAAARKGILRSMGGR